MTREAEVKCMGCGKRRWVEAGEVPKWGMPECGCGELMIATGKARSERPDSRDKGKR